jgi:colicin import membrane protein
MEETALVAIEELDIAKLFTDEGMQGVLQEIESKALSFAFDIETDQGRKDIASLAYKVARSKTLIDNTGKDTVADWKKKTKLIDGYRKQARDFLDDLKEKVEHIC